MQVIKKWFNNGKIETLCKPENKPIGFVKGRLPKPKKRDILSKQICKQDLFEYYIIENNSFQSTAEHFNISRNDLRILITLYNIRKDPKEAAKKHVYKRTKEEAKAVGLKSSITQKRNWENSSEEYKEIIRLRNQRSANMHKEERVIKTRITNSKKSIEVKAEENAKRSQTLKKTWAQNKEDILDRMHSTGKKNKKQLFCRTKLEQEVYDKLNKKFDVQYDVKVDERYPFFVDFYIKNLDLFIELNGHPSHGHQPYNKNNVESIEESYNLYGDWLNTYVKRDVEKRNIAQANNLNYLTIYPSSNLEKNYEINNNKFKEIIDIILA